MVTALNVPNKPVRQVSKAPHDEPVAPWGSTAEKKFIEQVP